MCSPQTQQPQDVRDEHLSTFTTDSEQCFQDNASANGPGHPSNAGDDRAGNDVGFVTLGLPLFMVNLSQVLICDFRQTDPDFGVLGLKSYYRGCEYATEMLKILPQKPDDILVTQLFQKIATLGSIHMAKSPGYLP